MANSNILMDMWYSKRKPWLSIVLLPVSCLFHLLIVLRRAYYRHIVRAEALPLPVIVVGNINLGGSGKSPLLIALALHLKSLGYSPGVISRGYGSSAPHYPFVVTADTAADIAGDEPLMIAQRCGCPVVIDADRLAAANKLIELGCCDLILSDDGLQHYRLPRQLEIVVVDGQRYLGNERLLPAGPLREPASRLGQVDWVAVNGAVHDSNKENKSSGNRYLKTPETRVDMQLRPVSWQRLSDGEALSLAQKPWISEGESEGESGGKRCGRVHAVAGIGNPQRFFQTLADLGVDFIPHAFSDHHHFQWADIDFPDELPVVMTEKDAVKCRALLKEKAVSKELNRCWFLSVEAQLDERFYREFASRLRDIQSYLVAAKH